MRLVDVYPYCEIQGQIHFLLLHRAPGTIYAGQWRMVGGKATDGETHVGAAIREFSEETALPALNVWIVPTVNSFYDPALDQVCQIPAFAIQTAHTPPQLNHEHDDFGWFTLGETMKRLGWYEQQRIVDIVHHVLTSDAILPEWVVSS